MGKKAEQFLQSLARRLDADQLTTEDKERLELTRRIREHRKQGKTLRQTAELLGENQRKIEGFTLRNVYKFFCGYLDNIERGTDEKAIEMVARKAKLDFTALAPDALDYYRSCFKRNAVEDQEEKGLFADDDKAMWAADKVAKGLGLTEPTHVVRPVVNIALALIQHETSRVEEDDDAARAALAIDVTPSLSKEANEEP